MANKLNTKQTRRMENTILHLQDKCVFLQTENKGLKSTVFYKKKRRKRGKKLIEEYRSKEGHAALFMSPSKI